MSRMKDITDSHKNFNNEERAETSAAPRATFSNLMDIKNSLKEETRQAVTPPTKKPEKEIKKEPQRESQQEPSKEAPRPPKKQPEKQSKEATQSESNEKLYNTLIKILNSYKAEIENDQKIDVSNLLPYLPKLVKATIEENDLLVKALHPGRTGNWFCSHSLNTAIISIKIGYGLQYNNKQLYALALSVLLHDVGMLKINPVILNKPGKLSTSERIQINNHPNYGADILQHLSAKYPFLIKTIREEHEKWNGEGYPAGLKKEEITPFARIITLADKFESLVHERNYRPGYKPPAAIQKLIQEHQNDFDPKVLKAFINVISMYPVGSHVLLNNGQIGQVMSINQNRPVRPLVKVLTNSEGKQLSSPYVLNLEKEPLTYITKSVNFLH